MFKGGFAKAVTTDPTELYKIQLLESILEQLKKLNKEI